jgi:hypothetical protein
MNFPVFCDSTVSEGLLVFTIISDSTTHNYVKLARQPACPCPSSLPPHAGGSRDVSRKWKGRPLFQIMKRFNDVVETQQSARKDRWRFDMTWRMDGHNGEFQIHVAHAASSSNRGALVTISRRPSLSLFWIDWIIASSVSQHSFITDLFSFS